MYLRIILIACSIFHIGQVGAQTIMNIHLNDGNVVQFPLTSIDSITYNVQNPGNPATISTAAFSSITTVTALSGGDITDDGGSPVTNRGVCWSTSPNPTTADLLTDEGPGTGTFVSALTGLQISTTYYARSYAINSFGTAYGNEETFTTTAVISNFGASVTFDGYSYPTVLLGNGQEWFSENLRTMVFSNGDTVLNVSDPLQWSSSLTGMWCNYDNEVLNENSYGKLYNWYAVNDSRNLCPAGWHVSTNQDWLFLAEYLGGYNTAAEKLKSTGTLQAGTGMWTDPNIATNESGFSALPGGSRAPDGVFQLLTAHGDWWCSSEFDSSTSFFRYMTGSQELGGGNTEKTYGLSVRCVKD
jgi:uncharacterized protein (TIGR02145 family)